MICLPGKYSMSSIVDKFMFAPLIIDRTTSFTASHIISLLNDEIACIIIDNFYPNVSCKKIANFLQSNAEQFKKYSNIDAKVLGNPLYWEDSTLAEYLENSESSQQNLLNISLMLNIENPIDIVLKLFNSTWGEKAMIAEDKMGKYFAGDIRIINNAGLHTDLVTRNIKTGILGRIKQQMSWNIYLSEPKKGFGELEIFNKKFDESDVKYKKDKGFGYKYQVVKGCSIARIHPKTGRFVLFKSSNYHRIKRNPQSNLPRITITSFIGYLGNKKPLILWS